MTVEEAQPPALNPPPASASLAATSPAGSAAAESSFLQFSKINAPLAKEFLNKVSEVTGVNNIDVLKAAFDATSAQGQNDNSVATAIEWILEHSHRFQLPPHKLTTHEVGASQRPPQAVLQSVSEMPPAVAMNRADVVTQPVNPPNSPNHGSNGQKPLVDLTEGSGGGSAGNTVVPGSEDAELQRAIKLSLQDQGRNREGFGGSAFSQEDQDVSRALEASLLESQNGAKRKRGENWVDPLNPHDRERSGLWPVGLKNVGQTCWFSAVMQSLFHIPAFRNLVLNYHPSELVPPPNGLTSPTDERQKKMIEFMQELRRLFALMVASQRKYVDPTRAVDILRGSIGSSTSNGDNNQQDVSEFTHIVLEWVEQAFKKIHLKRDERMEEEENAENVDPNAVDNRLADEEPNPSESNAMSKLFYGSLLTEGNLDGKVFSKKELFGQFPLQVNSYKDIHDSLESSTAHEYFDTTGENTSGQERWFTELPPVLFFSLSRFQFNQERRLAEKIHNRLDFPEVLYMDRYMANNKGITRQKRDQVKELKEQRVELASKLEKFTHFGSADEKMALASVLQATLDFAAAGVVTPGGELAPDISMASPPDIQLMQPLAVPPSATNPAAASLMQVDSPCPSPKMTPAHSLNNLSSVGGMPPSNVTDAKDESVPMDVEMSSKEDDDEAPVLTPMVGSVSGIVPPRGCDNSEKPPAAAPGQSGPSPRQISEVELRVLQSCLSRWRNEVARDVSGLDAAIQDIDKTIEGMYAQENLKQLQYRLHGVMVHEGGIESGHYWAYVFDHRKRVWQKFNDNTVTEATWEELLKESVGGHSNTSAYSLVYIDAAKPDILSDKVLEGESSMEKMESGAIESLINTLPNDLASFVADDNLLFEEERRKWDLEQDNRKKKEAILREAGVSGADPSGDVEVLQEKLTYVHTHAKLSVRTSHDIIRSYIASLKGNPLVIQVALQSIVDRTRHSYQRLLQPPPDAMEFSEVRLESFILYLLKNGVSKELADLAILEQFSLPGLDNDGQHAAALRAASDESLIKHRKSLISAASELKDWHQAYHLFRVSANCYVSGVDYFLRKKFELSLDLFIIAYNVSVRIMESPPKASFKGLRTSPLVNALCQSLLEVNSTLIKQFKLGERLNDILTRIQQLVIPALMILEARIARQESSNLNSGQSQKPSSMIHTCARLREDWCALLAETSLPPECQSFTTQILEAVLDPAVRVGGVVEGSANIIPRSCDHIEQSEDLKLSVRYREAVKHMRDFQSNLVELGGSPPQVPSGGTNPSTAAPSPSGTLSSA